MSMTVAALVADALIANGMTELYCLPGVQNDPFFDAVFDRTDRLHPIQTRHEQGAAYMALGAALATGKPQAFCVVPGPGFLNTTAALATAWAVNAPVLGVIGQIPLPAVGKGFGLLHEIPDQLGIMQRLCKHAERITGAGDAEPVLRGALQALASGRPRPVAVEIPVSAWSGEVSREIDDLSVKGLAPPAVDDAQIEAAVRMLSEAQRPMIVVGGGAQAHSASITQLAERVGAPIVAFRNGQGVVSASHELSINTPTAHHLWPAVDLVVGLGTRLNTQRMGWGTDEALKVIHIDIDAQELSRLGTPDVPIHGDLALVLPALLAALDGSGAERREWRNTVHAARAHMDAVVAAKLAPQLAWLSAIRDSLPAEGIFVDELTQMGYVARFAFPSYLPRTQLSTGYQGTLGYGFATALGAAHARRDVPVVAISGDGGALFTISELATAVHHQIPLSTIVFNDNAFGNVRLLQNESYGGRRIASDLSSPDFVKLAESFGAVGMRAQTPDALREQLARAVAMDAPVLIEVPLTQPMPSPWEFILMPKVRGV